MSKGSAWESYLLGVALGDIKGIGPFLIRILLNFLEIVYLILARADRSLTKPRRLPVPVISVGNLVAGGTGKTPVVVWLARSLKEAGFIPAVLTRGHGGQASKDGLIIRSEALSEVEPEVTGDEPYLLAKLLPETTIAVGRNRLQSGKQVLEAEPETDLFILDDGFQYWKLFRNLDILLLDAERPFGNGHLIPRGILREPVSGLTRAGIIFLTRTNRVAPEQLEKLTGFLTKKNPAAVIAIAKESHNQLYSLENWLAAGPGVAAEEFLKGRRVAAITGIGNPKQFLASLENLWAEVGYFKAYPDHYFWANREVFDLAKGLKDWGFTEIIVTAKDGVKLEPYLPEWRRNGLTCYILDLEFEIPDQRVWDKIKAIVKKGE